MANKLGWGVIGNFFKYLFKGIVVVFKFLAGMFKRG